MHVTVSEFLHVEVEVSVSLCIYFVRMHTFVYVCIGVCVWVCRVCTSVRVYPVTTVLVAAYVCVWLSGIHLELLLKRSVWCVLHIL